MTILETIKEDLKSARKRKRRIRTILLHMRSLERWESYSDSLLLNTIVGGLTELGEPYSADEVRSAFKEVNPDDYDSETKRGFLNNLLREARDKSVF